MKESELRVSIASSLEAEGAHLGIKVSPYDERDFDVIGINSLSVLSAFVSLADKYGIDLDVIAEMDNVPVLSNVQSVVSLCQTLGLVEQEAQA